MGVLSFGKCSRGQPLHYHVEVSAALCIATAFCLLLCKARLQSSSPGLGQSAVPPPTCGAVGVLRRLLGRGTEGQGDVLPKYCLAVVY